MSPCEMRQWIKRPSGLVDRRELPELTREAAIDRSWRVPEGGTLLLPEAEKYLPTYPLPEWHVSARTAWTSDWTPAYPLAEFL